MVSGEEAITCEINAIAANHIVLPKSHQNLAKIRPDTEMLYYIHQTSFFSWSVEPQKTAHIKTQCHQSWVNNHIHAKLSGNDLIRCD